MCCINTIGDVIIKPIMNQLLELEPKQVVIEDLSALNQIVTYETILFSKSERIWSKPLISSGVLMWFLRFAAVVGNADAVLKELLGDVLCAGGSCGSVSFCFRVLDVSAHY